ncbi:hypothetical protein SPKIRA_13650 [Sphingomonas paucimobilis]|uniref:DNA, contig: SP607 n=2 Tax=Sphingomonas paucimobilis TaxID=13689 RepID=A0A0C9NC58_SPHPI|nr:hypothetical protein SPKIRA_13650 [Sphingomonas paucimobilis]GAN12323.1 hypothetical protein SP6_07_01090 [Sphingomonas paucimobilis NBRC 13935]
MTNAVTHLPDAVRLKKGVTTMLISLLIASTLSMTAPDPTAGKPAAPQPQANQLTDSASVIASLPPTTRICVVDRVTGSNIPVKVCHTADEWIARDGAVPTGKIKRR